MGPFVLICFGNKRHPIHRAARNMGSNISLPTISNRYEIHSQMGGGADGLVYRAFDLERNAVVALKSLRFHDAVDLFNLKTEFRSLADIYHPNLVELYELVAEPDRCFYTMELVNGTDFVSYVRSYRDPGSDINFSPDALTRCRLAVSQLMDGLEALHSHHKLHWDVKPSNIMIEPDGRVILLDFGISVELQSIVDSVTPFRSGYGTPAYMSPERFADDVPGPAGDIFGVGVMMYEALTGALPFESDTLQGLELAHRNGPVNPLDLNSDIPGELGDLILSMLRFDVAERATLEEIRRQLDGQIESEKTGKRAAVFRPNGSVLGRGRQIARLHRAFQKGALQRTNLIAVKGAAGAGKSALIGYYANKVQKKKNALFLRSRCRHQETVSYNAIDGLIDNLSRYLDLQTEHYGDTISPEKMAALIKVFPVLGRHEFYARAAGHSSLKPDPHAVRADAIEAIAQIFKELIETRRLAIWIDDAHWADKASIEFLWDLFFENPTLNVPVIVSYRTDEKSNVALDELVNELEGSDQHTVETIDLPPLGLGEIKSLFAELGVRSSGLDDGFFEKLRRDSQGNPFFLHEFARHLQNNPVLQDSKSDSMLGLDTILSNRIEELGKVQKVALELVATSGHPLAESAIFGIEADIGSQSVALYRLCREKFLHRSVVSGQMCVECYHDLVRKSVLNGIPIGDRPHRHRQLMSFLETHEPENPARIVDHAIGAGEKRKAGGFALDAARQFDDRLAFDQAAEMYAIAIQNLDDPKNEKDILANHASALSNAGRPIEAAQQFRLSAERTNSNEMHQAVSVERKAKAAFHYTTGCDLRTGHEIFREVFEELGLRFPRTLTAAFLVSLRNRIVFGRGLKKYDLTAADRSSEDDLIRLETLHVSARSMVMLDFAVGDAMISWFLREALRCGDQRNMFFAVGLEASAFANIGGNWGKNRSERLMEKAGELSRLLPESYVQALYLQGEASVAWFEGRWADCAQRAKLAIEIYESECVGTSFELTVTRSFRLCSLVFQGRYLDAAEEEKSIVADAHRRGDDYALISTQTGFQSLLPLSRDDPQSALEQTSRTMLNVPEDRFTSLHYVHFISTANSLMYMADIAGLTAFFDLRWPQIRRAGFLRLSCIGTFMRDLKSRALLTSLACTVGKNDVRSTNRALREVSLHAKEVSKHKLLPHSSAFASSLMAGVSCMTGQKEAAIDILPDAIEGFEAAGMEMHRLATQYWLGEIMDNSEGMSFKEEAHEKMSKRGVHDPYKFSALLMPAMRV